MADDHFIKANLAEAGKDAHDPSMELRDRIAKLEASFDRMKVFMTISVAVTLGGFAFLGNQTVRLEGRMDRMESKLESRIDRIDTKVDAVPTRLSEEFQAMRADMAAQTAAIASAVTAARAVQPQIVVMPPAPPPLH